MLLQCLWFDFLDRGLDFENDFLRYWGAISMVADKPDCGVFTVIGSTIIFVLFGAVEMNWLFKLCALWLYSVEVPIGELMILIYYLLLLLSILIRFIGSLLTALVLVVWCDVFERAPMDPLFSSNLYYISLAVTVKFIFKP